jgi:beta-lactamase class D
MNIINLETETRMNWNKVQKEIKSFEDLYKIKNAIFCLKCGNFREIFYPCKHKKRYHNFFIKQKYNIKTLNRISCILFYNSIPHTSCKKCEIMKKISD